MIYVVGSGPTGVSCATALLQKRQRVTLLDLGLELEPERSDQLIKLRNLGSEKWEASDLAFLKQASAASIDGIPLKYAYGSDFPYRVPDVDWVLECDGVETRPSFARGGLSTVWGAAILPYRQIDIGDWPVREHELVQHYRAVLEFMPLAGRHDSLEEFFPLHSDRMQELRMSRQAAAFLEDLNSSAGELKREGIIFGASRLAVRSQRDNHLPGCCYCGNCMYGCPYELIYSSSSTLETLRQNPNFSYRKDVAVDRLVERGESVTLLGRDIKTNDRLQLRGSRVFLACGVLGTTKILLDSLEAFDQPLTLKDSFYFLLPLVRFQGTKGVRQEPLHTLAQAFLEIVESDICSQTIHLQIYSYNDFYVAALRKLFGPAYPLLRRATEMLTERLMLIQGYLPSSYSPSIRMVLHRDSQSRSSTLWLSEVANAKTLPALNKLCRKLRRSYISLSAIPVGFLSRPGKPGRGFHSGGTFPMQERPAQFQSDVYGRPYGFRRVHAVDATIFPSIPATTITFSAMANAHRVGSSIGDY